ncbi:MAG TPA: bacillithiol biosynthesis deacetylase BshB1 [Vicinamibacterales bacterium]|nr:bacillithiol biosynthesis deacetylase BshB1 [Vicinamibacterales bacterium]
MIDAVDLLVFGPHPDDLEIGLGGAIAKHVSLGHRVGLCDLTRGELGTNGTPEERVQESEAARQVLGAAWRENLGLPDGDIGGDASHRRTIVELIRRVRPNTIAIPYDRDRHPDHVAASRLLTRAAFLSGLSRFAAGGGTWRADWLLYYFINDSTRPSFVVDVSAHYETKRAALACHRSQFTPPSSGAAATRLNTPRFQQLIESRDAQFGALIGVEHAEGVVVRELMARQHLLK